MFTKAELIEAIKHNQNGISNYCLDNHLIYIQSQKSEKILKEMNKINQQIKAATTIMEFLKLEKKWNELNKKLDKINESLK